jgi:hypothetical protein
MRQLTCRIGKLVHQVDSLKTSRKIFICRLRTENVIFEVNATYQSVCSKIHEFGSVNVKAVLFLHSTPAAVLGIILLNIEPIKERRLNNNENLSASFSGYDIRVCARTSLYSLPLDLFADSVLSLDRRN